MFLPEAIAQPSPWVPVAPLTRRQGAGCRVACSTGRRPNRARNVGMPGKEEPTMAVASATPRGYLERPRPSGLADVIDVILDKGLVIDAYVRVSL
jgi:hypothetical protein